MSEHDEQTFLRTGDCLVTSSRIQFENQTFATRNVSGVAVVPVRASFFPWLVAAFGVFIAFSSGGVGIVVGTSMAIGAALIGWKRRRRYNLTMHAGGGQSVALTTHDRHTAQQLHEAIVRAIAAR